MAPTPPADPLQTLIETWRTRASKDAKYGVAHALNSDREYYGTVNAALALIDCADELAAALVLREAQAPAASKQIVAEMRPDWIEPYARSGNLIPVVITSTHPRFTVGTRLDWGFVSVALRDGYNVDLRQPALPMSPDEGQG